MVVTSRCFAFRALITQARIWKSFWVQNSTSLLYLPITSLAETWKVSYQQTVSFFNQYHNKEFCVFSREIYFIKATENFFSLFAQPDNNTLGVGRILDSYANPRLRLGFVQLSRILPTPLVFILGYANTENVFYW